MSDELTVRFWGVRGSLPSCAEDARQFGGDTACIEVSCGDKIIVIDCGSGLLHLGRDLRKRAISHMDLFVTHYHFDHLCGLPFFCRAYDPSVTINAYSPILEQGATLRSALDVLMSPPLFPVGSNMLKAMNFHDFEMGTTTRLETGAVVRSMALNHPGGSCGYRVEWCGHSIAIITDFEHAAGESDLALIEFVRNADVMIYDAMFTDADYDNHVGWGHSTDGVCLRLAKDAGVKQPVLFHHAPLRSDDDLNALQSAIKAYYPEALVGYSGLELTFPKG